MLNSRVGIFYYSLLPAFFDQSDPVLVEDDISAQYPRGSYDVLGVVFPAKMLFRENELESEESLLFEEDAGRVLSRDARSEIGLDDVANEEGAVHDLNVQFGDLRALPVHPEYFELSLG